MKARFQAYSLHHPAECGHKQSHVARSHKGFLLCLCLRMLCSCFYFSEPRPCRGSVRHMGTPHQWGSSLKNLQGSSPLPPMARGLASSTVKCCKNMRPQTWWSFLFLFLGANPWVIPQVCFPSVPIRGKRLKPMPLGILQQGRGGIAIFRLGLDDGRQHLRSLMKIICQRGRPHDYFIARGVWNFYHCWGHPGPSLFHRKGVS